MRSLSTWRLIGIGAALEVIGVALPMLMVVGVLPSTWALNGVAFLSGVSGLFLGYWGVLMMIQARRGHEEHTDTPEPWAR